jgi:hypothetical protein
MSSFLTLFEFEKCHHLVEKCHHLKNVIIYDPFAKMKNVIIQ